MDVSMCSYVRDRLIAYICVYRVSKSNLNNCTLFYCRKMCECIQISSEKCDDVSEYSYEKCEWW